MSEQRKIQGWKDVQITADMPLNVLVNFMNVLNQRLVALEDSVTIPVDNKMISLTEFYALQAEAQQKAMEEEMSKDMPETQPEEEKGE